MVIRLADKAGRACPALKDLGMGAEVNKGAAMRPEENNVRMTMMITAKTVTGLRNSRGIMCRGEGTRVLW